MTDLSKAIAELLRAYDLLMAEEVEDQRRLATGIIMPVIEMLEEATEE